MIRSLLISWKFFIVVTSAAVHLQTDRIDINEGLRIFDDCFIHIILNHLDVSENLTFVNGSYKLLPNVYPTVLSKHNYFIKSIEDSATTVSSNCLKLNIKLRGNQTFLFNSYARHVSQRCAVVFYITSPICNGPIITSRPPDFWHMLKYPNLSLSRGFSSSIFLAYVDRKGSRSREGYFLEEIVWGWQKGLHKSAYFFLPIIISFQIKTFISVSPLETAVDLFVCPDFRSYLESVQRLCGRYVDSPHGQDFTICVRRLHRHYLNVERQILLTPLLSWKEVEATKSDSCIKNAPVLMPFTEDVLPPLKIKSEYVLQWHRSIGSISNIFLRIIIKNLTYISFPSSNFHRFALLYSMATRLYRYPKKYSLNAIANLPQIEELQLPVMVSELSFTGRNNEVHFVICSPDWSEFLSISPYVSAFSWHVWITLIVTANVGVLLFHQVSCRFIEKKSQFKGPKIKFHIFLHIFGILVAQGTTAFKRDKLFYGGWILGGLVLTNAYLGDNINRLTAPTSPIKPDTFEKILDLGIPIHSPATLDRTLRLSREIAVTALEWAIGKSSALLTEKMEAVINALDSQHKQDKSLKNSNLTYIASIFGYLFIHRNIHEPLNVTHQRLNQVERGPNNLAEFFNVSGNENTYYLNMTSQCTSEAYVDSLSNVLSVKLQLHHLIKQGKIKANEHDIVMSIEKYGQLHLNIFMFNFYYPQKEVIRNGHILLHSGIDQFWFSWKSRIDTWNDTIMAAGDNDESFKPVSLRGNAVVLFYVHYGLLSVSFIFFAFECIRKYFEGKKCNFRKSWCRLFRAKNNGRSDKKVFRTRRNKFRGSLVFLKMPKRRVINVRPKSV